MKNNVTSLFIALALALLPKSLQAIPNQIGGVGFVNPAGMRFENFAALTSTWKANAKLPGDWQDWQDPLNKDSHVILYRLNMHAEVFGISASQITAQVKDDKISLFKIIFEKSSKQTHNLVDQVITNIRSFTGNTSESDQESFNFKKINIRVQESANGAVIVTIRPQTTAVTSR
ncbi:MAG: hypothetical protein QM496_16665 [Verrucomicrobiota bacterium]